MKETHHDRLIDSLRQRTGDRRSGKYQRPAGMTGTPEAIRRRSIDKLTQRKPQNIGAVSVICALPAGAELREITGSAGRYISIDAWHMVTGQNKEQWQEECCRVVASNS